jgi:ankyrin repeat protein
VKQIHKDMGDDCTIESSEFSSDYNCPSTRKGFSNRLQSKRKEIKNHQKLFLSFVVPTSYNTLHLTCRTGSSNDVEEMINCEDINSNDGMENHGATPLHVALIHEKYDVAMSLLQKGAFVGAVANNGWTPLHIASSMGCVEIVNCLLEVYKADSQSRDSRGWTPLFVSIFRGHIGVIQLLLGKETCSRDFRNVKDYYGQTMLMIACQGGHEDAVELLLSMGVHDIHARDQDGWTVLNYAERKENSRILMHMLKKYASKGVGHC